MKKMKRIFRIVPLLILWVIPLHMNAQEQGASSLLWKIEGNGIKTAYLYGTIHMLPQSDFDLKDKVINAFSESEIIIMELDMDDPGLQAEMMKLAPMRNGNTLEKILSPEDYSRLKEELAAKNIPIEAVQSMKPFMVSAIFLAGLIEGTPASFEGAFVENGAGTG